MSVREQLEVLDRIWLILWPLAVGGDERATRGCEQVVERRARLLGLR